jgi:cytochrome P450
MPGRARRAPTCFPPRSYPTAPPPRPQTFPWLLRLCDLAAEELAADGAGGRPVDVAEVAARLTSDTIGDMLLG